MFTISPINYTPSEIQTILPKPVSQKICAKLTPYYALNASLESIKQRASINPAYTLNDAELSQVKAAFINCHQFFAGNLLKNLAALPLAEVKKAVFKALEEDAVDVKANLSCLLKTLNQQAAIDFAAIHTTSMHDALEANILLKTRALHSVLATKGKAIWQELSYETSYFCHHLIETFISVTGFSEVGGRQASQSDIPAGSYEAKAKLELYASLLAYPSVLFVSCFAALGSAAAAGLAAAAIITASILFIPIYLRYLRPCPHQYRGLVNLNQKMLRAENAPLLMRADILDRIQNAFCAGKGVILTGEPGTGKSSIADALASMIVAKDAKPAAGFLNAAQMFAANASQFNGSRFDRLSFQHLSESFKDHKKSLVLFIDEIAALYEKDSQSGNQIKSFLTFLDTFPNVLCATTTEEYQKLIKDDEPVNRRLVHIAIKPLEPKELETALYQYLHYKAPELILEENVIPYIIDKARAYNAKTSQVDGAMSLLKSAITKATHLTFDELENEINHLKLEIEYLENCLLHRAPTDSNSKIEEYRQKQTTLKSVQMRLLQKQTALRQIKKIECISLQLKRQGYQLAAQRKTVGSTSPSQEWLITHATQQILSDFLIAKRNELGLPTGIDKALIDVLTHENTP